MNFFQKPPGLHTVLALLTTLVLVGCGKDGASVINNLNLAAELDQAGDFAGAVVVLKGTLQEFPDSVEGRTHLARLYADLGDGSSADKEISRALELGLNPTTAEPIVLKSMILTGKAKEAAERLEKMPGREDSAEYLSLYGAAELRLGKLDSSLAQFERALKLEPGNADAMLGMARVFVAKRDLDTGREYAAKSLIAYPNNANAHLLDGELKLAAAQYEPALAAFEQAARLNPYSAAPLIAQARTYLILKELDKADAVLERAKSAFPHNGAIAYYQGVTRYEAKDFEAASSRFREVLSYSPDHSVSQFYLGLLMYQDGNLEQAEELITLFAKAFPDYVPGKKLLASIQIKRGNAQAAVQTLGGGLKSLQEDPQMVGLLASALLAAGEIDKGLGALKQLRVLSPDDDLVRTSLALAQLHSGHGDEAVTMLESEIELKNDGLYSGMILIYAYLSNRDWDQAIGAANDLLEEARDEPALYNALGLAYVGKDNVPEARAAFQNALSLSPAASSTIRNLTKLDLRVEDYAAAQSRIAGLLEMDPDDPGTLVLAGRVAMLSGDPSGAVGFFKRARTFDRTALEPRVRLLSYYMSTQDYREAYAVAKEAAELAPNQPPVLLGMAESQMHLGNLDDAAGIAEKAAELFPDAVRAQYLAGIIKLEQSQFNQAGAFLDRAVELAPADPKVLAAWIESAVRRGLRDDARKGLEKLEAMDGENGAVSVLRGAMAEASGDFRSAAEHYEAALAVDQSNRTAIMFYRSLVNSGQLDRAESEVDARIARFPDVVELRIALGQVYEALGKKDDAIRVYESVIERQGDSVIALNNLAMLKYGRGDAGALELADRAYRLLPGNPEIADTYGWLLIQRNRVEESVRVLKEAASASPKSGHIRYHYAVALAKQGDKPAALAELDEALTLKDSGFRKSAERLRQTLQR